MQTLTALIRQVQTGEQHARDRLFAAAYDELRQMARARLRRGGRSSVLDTTALLHESYLKFVRGGTLRCEDQRAFFAYASRIMRSVIVDDVRERQAERRGGDLIEVALDTEAGAEPSSGSDEVLRVHDALLALEEAEPRLAKVVEMRYFGGYSEGEIAEALELTDRTVRRDWGRARLLLMAMLKA